MKLKWLGHSCFLITANHGLRIVIDPFSDTVGYAMPDVTADVVTVSHEHQDHNYAKGVKGNFELINKPGRFEKKGVEIIGIPAFHDSVNGTQKGKNTIFKFIVDGIEICHCGDLGHLLMPEQIKEIGHVDVLLVPVGGFFTIDHGEAAQVVKQLKPTVTVPMHFKTTGVRYPIKDEQPFVKAMGGAKKIEGTEIELNKDNLEDYTGVILFKHA